MRLAEGRNSAFVSNSIHNEVKAVNTPQESLSTAQYTTSLSNRSIPSAHSASDPTNERIFI